MNACKQQHIRKITIKKRVKQQCCTQQSQPRIFSATQRLRLGDLVNQTCLLPSSLWITVGDRDPVGEGWVFVVVVVVVVVLQKHVDNWKVAAFWHFLRCCDVDLKIWADTTGLSGLRLSQIKKHEFSLMGKIGWWTLSRDFAHTINDAFKNGSLNYPP